MQNQLKVILSFDLDFTLINNKQGIINSFNYALRKFNLPELEDIKIEKMIGIPLVEMFGSVSDLNPIPLTTAFREYYGKKGIYQSKLLSGVKKKLNELRESGFQLGVITSKKQEMAIKIAEYLKIGVFFDYILGESNKIRSKMDQNLKIFLFEKYPNSNFIIIGDHPKDALLSKNLNCPFIGVLTGSHAEDSLRKARSNDKLTLILKSVKQISVDAIHNLLDKL